MESNILLLLNETLVSITATFLVMLIPFCGAYWIFKKTLISNAESKIFQIGRQIAHELHSATDIRSPLGMIAYSFIDRNIRLIDEQNRDIAIHELLKKLLFQFPSEDNFGGLDDKERSQVIVAIVTDRFENLVPHGVTWSGKGSIYSSFGEEIKVENQLFPFGTKLYKRWIDRFSVIYNDLWMCTSNRHQYIETFVETDKFRSADEINDWLDNIESNISVIHGLHSELITQTQIIDEYINEKYFKRSLIICGLYLFLLALSGFFAPKILEELDILTGPMLVLLSLVSLVMMFLVTARLLTKSGQIDEKFELRRIYLGDIQNRLKEMRTSSLRYKEQYFENTLSRSKELKLPKRLRYSLEQIIELIREYNEKGECYKNVVSPKVEAIKQKFVVKESNQGGFGFQLQEIPDQDFDFSSLCSRIKNEDGNFNISQNEQHSSRELLLLNLTRMSNKKRTELIEELAILREDFQFSSEYKNLKRSRHKLLESMGQLEKKIARILSRQPFDLIIRLSSTKN